MKTTRRTEPRTAAAIECKCGTTIYFTSGAPDRDTDGRLICSTCKWGPPPAAPVAQVAIPAAPISETRAIPSVCVTSDELIAGLTRSLTNPLHEAAIKAMAGDAEYVAGHVGQTPSRVGRTAVELDPHERRELTIRRSHRVGVSS